MLAEGEAVEAVQNKGLTKETLVNGLSAIGRTGDGLAHAFTKINLNAKDIDGIELLSNYPHLRYVVSCIVVDKKDISENEIQNVDALAVMQHLLSLDCSKNKMTEVPAALDDKPFWQFGHFAGNQIHKFSVKKAPLLYWLNLNENQLQDLELEHFPNLQHLECRANQLEKMSKLNAPNLREIYAAKNNLTAVRFLADKPQLEKLHLRENKINFLDGFHAGLENLSYINLRENQIFEFAELEKLACLPKLKKINLRGNPIHQDSKYRAHVVLKLPQLEVLDKMEITQEDRDAANELKDLLEKERLERLEKEEEERRLKAEQDAAEAANKEKEMAEQQAAEAQQANQPAAIAEVSEETTEETQ